jgi:hypothetical protein
MTDYRQKACLYCKIHNGIDKDLRLLATGILNFLDRVSTVFPLADIVTSHERTILNQVVDKVFIVRLACAISLVILLYESDFRDFADNAKSPASEHAPEGQFCIGKARAKRQLVNLCSTTRDERPEHQRRT